MAEFIAKTICILGRQPSLGVAELESIYGSQHVQAGDGFALMDIPAAQVNFKNLGGTLKVAQFLTEVNSTAWPAIKQYLIKNIPTHLNGLPEGKFTLGLSVYGLNTDVNSINQAGLAIKKVIRKSGRPVRIVPNKNLELGSAQVLYNQLTKRGGWELLLIKNGNRTIIAQTLFVQDIDAYAARDQARPARDSRVGMLPPKLAQIIINLAVGVIDPEAKIRILDPFCGTGVVLQEALLMDYSVYGTDIDERMIEYSKRNVQWLIEQYPQIEKAAIIEQSDATTANWASFNAVACETALGPPLTALPPNDKLKPLINDTNLIIKKFLKNLGAQLKPGARLCIAVPEWRQSNGQRISLPLIDQIDDMGYNWVDFQHVERNDLIYYREDQTVARRLLVLTKKV